MKGGDDVRCNVHNISMPQRSGKALSAAVAAAVQEAFAELFDELYSAAETLQELWNVVGDWLYVKVRRKPRYKVRKGDASATKPKQAEQADLKGAWRFTTGFV